MVSLFHKDYEVPLAPTFGVKFHGSRQQQIDEPLGLFGAVFNSARHCLDYDFIIRNPDYRKLVSYIDPGPHYWLDFSMGNADKRDLFMRGAQAAAAFLRRFEWEDYKRLRADRTGR